MSFLLEASSDLVNELETEQANDIFWCDDLINTLKQFGDSMGCSIVKNVIICIGISLVASILLFVLYSSYKSFKERKFKKTKFNQIIEISKKGFTERKKKIDDLYRSNNFSEDELFARLDFLNTFSDFFTGLRTICESVYVSLLVSIIVSVKCITNEEMLVLVLLAIFFGMLLHVGLEETLGYLSNKNLYEYEKRLLMDKLENRSKFPHKEQGNGRRRGKGGYTHIGV